MFTHTPHPHIHTPTHTHRHTQTHTHTRTRTHITRAALERTKSVSAPHLTTARRTPKPRQRPSASSLLGLLKVVWVANPDAKQTCWHGACWPLKLRGGRVADDHCSIHARAVDNDLGQRSWLVANCPTHGIKGSVFTVSLQVMHIVRVDERSFVASVCLGELVHRKSRCDAFETRR